MHYEETYKDQAMQTPLKIGTEIGAPELSQTDKISQQPENCEMVG
jgi:hypothetical protein